MVISYGCRQTTASCLSGRQRTGALASLLFATTTRGFRPGVVQSNLLPEPVPNSATTTNSAASMNHTTSSSADADAAFYKGEAPGNRTSPRPTLSPPSHLTRSSWGEKAAKEIAELKEKERIGWPKTVWEKDLAIWPGGMARWARGDAWWVHGPPTQLTTSLSSSSEPHGWTTPILF